MQVRKDFRSSGGILAQAKISLEVECSLDHFCSSERIFGQVRRILAQAKKNLFFSS